MGLGGISIWQLLIVLVIVIAIFGTKKLRGMGGDLGTAVKGFKNAVKEGTEDAKDAAGELEDKASDSIDSTASAVKSDKV